MHTQECRHQGVLVLTNMLVVAWKHPNEHLTGQQKNTIEHPENNKATNQS